MPKFPCCDPLKLPNLKKKNHKSRLSSLNANYVQRYQEYFPDVEWAVGMKLCKRCRCEIANKIKAIDEDNRAETASSMMREYIEAIPAAVGGFVADQGQSENEGARRGGEDSDESRSSRDDSQPLQVAVDEGNNGDSGTQNPQVIDESISNTSASIQSRSENNSEVSEQEIFTPTPTSSPKSTKSTSSNQNFTVPEVNDSPFTEQSGSASVVAGGSRVASSVGYFDKDVAADKLNTTLQSLGVSPLVPGIKRQTEKLREKVKRSGGKLATLFEAVAGPKVASKQKVCECAYCKRMIEFIEKRFPTLRTKKEKYSMLTCLPSTVKIADIQNNYGVSNYMARQVSKFRKEDGPFYSPDFKSSAHPISDEVKKMVSVYYLSDDNSRPSPVSNQTIKVRDEAGNVRVEAKRYMLVNSKEAYLEFKKENPTAKIGATKFVQLRPKNCKWPGNKGFPITCTCMIHENFKLMLEGLRNSCVDNVTQINDNEAVAVYAVLDNISEIAKFIICPQATEECYVGVCPKCPNEEKFETLFQYVSDEEIEFNFWETKPITLINELRLNVEEFKEKFRVVLNTFMGHEYIYRQQKTFLTELRAALPARAFTAVINVDFGENYSFVVQNAVQGFHWTNAQATIHPFVVYYAKQDDAQTKYKTYFVISDEMIHDATTFHTFRSKAIISMKRDLPHVTQVEYFSDGAGSQYKNYKNIINLAFHQDDYNLNAKWHFTATAHGKSMCDAMSAVVKRTCRLKSIRDGIRILSANDMYEAVGKQLTSETLEFIFVSKDEVKQQRETIGVRYNTAKKIPGIRKLHFFEALPARMVVGKVCSNSNVNETFSVVQEPAAQLPERRNYNAGDFYGMLILRNYQIGKVLMYNEHADECTVLLMRKPGKGGVALQWPPIPREHIIACNDLLGVVSAPAATTGTTYRLLPEDLHMIKQNLSTKLEQMQHG